MQIIYLLLFINNRAKMGTKLDKEKLKKSETSMNKPYTIEHKEELKRSETSKDKPWTIEQLADYR